MIPNDMIIGELSQAWSSLLYLRAHRSRRTL